MSEERLESGDAAADDCNVDFEDGGDVDQDIRSWKDRQVVSQVYGSWRPLWLQQ